MNLNLSKTLIAGIVFLVILVIIQRLAADPNINGLMAFVPYIMYVVLFFCIIKYWSKLTNWLTTIVIVSLGMTMTSCNFIDSDKIGVRVENYGKNMDDYHLVYGKFPMDWSASSWNLEYPGQSLNVEVPARKIFSKDGVEFDVDPSVLIELIRTDEACQKYSFKFSAYKDASSFEAALQQLIVKEAWNEIISTFASTTSDSLLFNRGRYEGVIQNNLTKLLIEKYGINLSQYSMNTAPPEKLQNAINDRLLEQEQTKKTIASYQNAEAKTKLAAIDRERMLIESQGLTPQMLKKYELELNYNAYIQLAQSQNKVFIAGTPTHIMIQQ